MKDDKKNGQNVATGSTDDVSASKEAPPAPETDTGAPPEPPAPQPPAADLEAALAEAEQRGYLRGRNERIEELMQRPGIMERDTTQVINEADGNGAEPAFLSRLNVSIWDR